MKIDYNKLNFNAHEKQEISCDAKVSITINPNYVPIILLINSNVLKIDKHKFIVADQMSINDYLKTLKKKFIHYNEEIALIYSLTNLSVDNSPVYKILDSGLKSMSLKDLYNKYKDQDTNMLVITVSRQTTYKWIKGLIGF